SLQPQRTEAVYSPKHRTGRCLFHPIRPDRRKDTAAYASLSFFTCQRAASDDAISEDNNASLRFLPGLSRQPVRETSEQPAIWQHRDEPDLGSFICLVNPAFENFES
ncbi:MAG TPA: hypothetical protein VEZ24_06180, partial [Microvirga sp.]|nr:hypothetical protein [Microvirga sp.]